MIPQGAQTAVFLLLKIASLVGLGVYMVFALIMVRQEQLMARVLEEGSEPVIRIAVLVHLIAALTIFGIAIVVL